MVFLVGETQRAFGAREGAEGSTRAAEREREEERAPLGGTGRARGQIRYPSELITR